MNKVTNHFLSVLSLMIIVLASCATQPTIIGLWQSTSETGGIEFKATGEVTVVDNMSARMIGSYVIEDDDLIKLEFNASDILRDSVQPMPKKVFTTSIIRINADELQLRIAKEDGEEKVETTSAFIKQMLLYKSNICSSGWDDK